MKSLTLASVLQGHNDKLFASKCDSVAEALTGISLNAIYLPFQLLDFMI